MNKRRKYRKWVPTKGRSPSNPLDVQRQPQHKIIRRNFILSAAIVLGTALLMSAPEIIGRWSQMVPVSSQAVPTNYGEGIDSDWVAAAPGKVEPSSGEIRVGALMLGRVAEILVSVNDSVGEGDLLVRLDDDEMRARLTSAEAEVAARKRDRDAASASGAAMDRRRAEDSIATAEQAVIAARAEVDRLSRRNRDDPSKEMALTDARKVVLRAQKTLELERSELARLKAANSKAPSQPDTALTIARAELAASQAQLEKTRIRAPIAGTILYLPVRVGETVAPSPDQMLLVLADISKLRVRADLDERNAGKVTVGQPAHIRAEAYPGDSFSGKVVSMGPALTPRQTILVGRRRGAEGNVVDVQVELLENHRLLPGMQVDVYFLRSRTEQGNVQSRADP
jgi:HlyD family secretion protein